MKEMAQIASWSPGLSDPKYAPGCRHGRRAWALAWVKYQPQWQSFPIDSDHSVTWDAVRADICQTPLITNIPQRHMWNGKHTQTHIRARAQKKKHMCVRFVHAHKPPDANVRGLQRSEKRWDEEHIRLIHPGIMSGQISPIINKWLTFPVCGLQAPGAAARTQQGLDPIPAVYQRE